MRVTQQAAWPVLLKTIKVFDKQEKSDSLLQTWDTVTKCSVLSWMGFWNSDKLLVEKLMKEK